MSFLPPIVAVITGDTAGLTADIDKAKAELASLDAEGDAALGGVGTAGRDAADGGLKDVETAAEDSSGALSNMGARADETKNDLSDVETAAGDAGGALGGVGEKAEEARAKTGALADTTRDAKSGLNDVETAASDASNALGSGGLGGKADEAGKHIDEAGEHSSVFSDKLGEIGKFAMEGGTALVTGIGAGSVKMAGDFQQSMTELVTGAGEADKNIKMVSAGILAMAPAVGKTPTELAQGMYMIESAGFHGAQGLDVLKAAAQGAAVGGAQMSDVANVVTSALNAYGLSGSHATSVTDQLVATVASGKMHMQDLATSVANVLPIAASAHVSFAQVGGALATMTMQGMSARRASMNLANMLRAIVAPSAASANEMKLLGLNANELSTHIGQVGLTGTLNQMTQAILRNTKGGSVMATGFASMTPPAKALAQQILAGTISSKNMSTAIQGLSPVQAALVTAFSKSATGATGLKQTFDGAMKTMIGGATGLNVALLLGGKHAGVFAHNVNTISDAASHAGKNVNGFSKASQDLNFKFDALKATAEQLMIKIGGALMPAVSKLAPVFGRLLTAVAPVVTVLGTTLANAVTALMPVVDTFVNDALLPLARSLGPVFTAIAKLIPPIMRMVAPILTLAASIISRLMPVVSDLITNGLLPLLSAFAPLVPTILQILPPFLDLSLMILRLAADLLTFKPILILIGALLVEAFLGPIGLVVVALLELVTHWRDVWNVIKNVGLAAWHFIDDNLIHPLVHFFVDVLPQALGVAVGFFERLPGDISRIATDAWHFFDNDIVHPLVNFFTDTVPHVISLGIGFFERLPGDIARIASDVWRFFYDDLVEPVARFFGVTVPSDVSKGVNAFKSLPGEIEGVFANAVHWLYYAGVAILQGLYNGIMSMAGGLVHEVESIGHTIIGAFSSVLHIFSPSRITHQHGVYLMQGLAEGMQEGYGAYVLPQIAKIGAGITAGGSFGSHLGVAGGGGVGVSQAQPVQAATYVTSNVTLEIDAQHLGHIMTPYIRAELLKIGRATGTIFGQYGGMQGVAGQAA